MIHIKLFEEMDSEKEIYHFYLHPCSTHSLYYAIPDKFDKDLRNDDNFIIGMYQTQFKEYLNTYYTKDRHGKLKGKTFIQFIGCKEIEMPEWTKKNLCTDKQKGIYYYQFVDYDWDKLGLDFSIESMLF